MKKLLLIFLFAAVGITVYTILPEKELRHPPGILVAEQPIQRNMSLPKNWQKEEFNIVALAEFHIKARVLSTNFFWSGKEKEISPVDFALGWGPMSDQAVLDYINISQRNRWYYWEANPFPIPVEQISLNSANMHIIPSNDLIEDLLDEVYKGCLIEMKGYLVEVTGEKGWRWKSSLRRDDTGGGSCELVYVEELKIIEGI
jgi:hypothetical protein